MEEDISDLSINSHPPMHTSTPYSSAQSSNKKRHLTRVRIEMSNDSMSSPLTKKKGNPIKHSIESESSKEDLKENKKSQFLSSSDEDGFLTDDEDVQQKNVSKILSTDHEDIVKRRNRILSEEDVRDKPIGQRKAKRLVDYDDEDDDGPADDIVNDSVVEESGDGKVKRDEEESSGSSADDDQNSIIDESPIEDDGNDFSIKEEESSQSKAEIDIVEDSEEMKNTIQIDDTADEVAQIPMKQKPEEKFPTKKLNNRIEEIKIASKNTRGPAVITPPKVDPTHKPIQLPPQHGRLFGGQMTDERLEKIKYITNDMISAMHKSLSTIPENITTESPKGLRIDLMPHQKHGLTWLLWREQQIPPSGILADDMGLGKTLSMISLILHKKNLRCSDAEFEENEKIRRKHYIQNKNLTMSHGTLVIAPASLIYQWEKEVRDRVKEDKLRVHVFHGPKNKRDISSHRLAKYDIVITTYDLLVSEFKSGPVMIGQSSDDSDSDESGQGTSKAKKKGKKKLPKHTDSVLAKIAWERVILDEAHEIRNRQAQKSKACCRLEAVHRWCLTGTPIHNKLWDLYSLVRFMRITPFNEEKMWKEYIDVNSNSRGSTERLNTIVKSILLRRTKNQICAETNKPIVDLQPRTHEIVKLDLQGWEKHCYSIMFEASRQKVKDLLHEADFGYKPKGDKIVNPFTAGGKMRAVNDFQAYSCILTLMLRLRQACVHMSLTKHAVDLEAFKEDGADIEDKNVADEIVQNVLEMSFAQMSLDADGIEEGMAKNKEMERIFEKEYPSAKVMAILSRLDKIIQAGDKCVIVSQWTSMLSIIEYHLRQKKITFTSITGEVKTDDRQSRLDNFNRANSGPIVMLLSLTAGGVGLNLIGGNHLFMVDLHWNPALEQQACDRIYRLGQKKSVFIHKFICNSTIEQRVLHIQEKKMAMSKSVLEGSASNKLTKLTREELKFLFELDRRPQQPEKIHPAAVAQPGTSKMNPN